MIDAGEHEGQYVGAFGDRGNPSTTSSRQRIGFRTNLELDVHAPYLPHALDWEQLAIAEGQSLLQAIFYYYTLHIRPARRSSTAMDDDFVRCVSIGVPSCWDA